MTDEVAKAIRNAFSINTGDDNVVDALFAIAKALQSMEYLERLDEIAAVLNTSSERIASSLDGVAEALKELSKEDGRESSTTG